MRFKIIAIVVVLVFQISFSQSVRINEVVTSNSVHLDEDGDTPDWIELYNYGTTTVSLLDWGISDDVDELTKWQFPNVSLQPDEYLLLWASSKDRSEVSFSRTLVNQGDTFRYIIPSSEPPSNWRDTGFNDSAWSLGASGIGYADGDDATVVPNGTSSVFTRIKFNVNDVSEITSLILDIDYDDGFVAYINGNQIARANMSSDTPAYNEGTLTDHEAQMYNGGNPDRFSVADPGSILVNGENVLAIQVHNISGSSSDLTLIPFLSAVYNSNTTEGVDPPAILNLASNLNLHTNFKLASDSETLTLSDVGGTIIDQHLIEGLLPDVSYGHSINTSDYVYYTATTPGMVNSNAEFSGVTQAEVQFSHEGGLLDNSISLVLSGNSVMQQIRYTTDATEPNFISTLYTGPIPITENTVIRAKAFQLNYIPSETASRAYIMNADHDLDVVSLVTEPDNLFDNETGIYVLGDDYDPNVPYFGANFWEDWERPIHFSLYDKDTDALETNFNAGVKIFGGWSRGQNDQRSLSIFARGRYGTSEIEYPFFEELSYDTFQSIVLRNSGQDWLKSSIKDPALTSLIQGSGLDYQAHRPVATYINGEYWGMYTIREKISEHMLAAKHNIDPDTINLLEFDGAVIEGTNEDYIALRNYITTTDLSDDTNFQYVSDRIDITNYALYQATQIFFANTDWPGNNMKFWNHSDGKWRWVLFDLDFCFGPFWNTGNYHHNTLSFALEENGPAWPNPPWSTLLFRKLTENIGFRNQFINRYADELNTRFLPNNVKDHFDAVFQRIQSEVQAHYQRWGEDPNVATFFVDEMKNYADNRPAAVKQHILGEFNLPAFHQITITNNDISEGLVAVNNNLQIQEPSWSGDYFETVPIELEAIPEVGYEFSHWSGAISSTDAIISIDMQSAMEVIPNFTQASIEALVINEINYKSNDAHDTKDWIELYNPNPIQLILSDWVLKDDDDTHTFIFPENTVIEANGYLVITRDVAEFNLFFPGITNTIGNFNFGFGGSDAVRLYNDQGILQDEVVYTNSSPWPTCADGLGPSLELISPELDNSLPENWDCINDFGSPDAVNSAPLSEDENVVQRFTLYPNPVNDIVYIDGPVDEFHAEIYTILGEKLTSGKYRSQIDCSNFPRGIYMIKISVEGVTSTHKMVKR